MNRGNVLTKVVIGFWHIFGKVGMQRSSFKRGLLPNRFLLLLIMNWRLVIKVFGLTYLSYWSIVCLSAYSCLLFGCIFLVEL